MYTNTMKILGCLAVTSLMALALIASPIPMMSSDGLPTIANDAQAQSTGPGPGAGGPSGSGNTGTGTGPGPTNRSNFGGGGGTGGGGSVPTSAATTVPGSASSGAGAYTPRTSSALQGGWCIDVPEQGQKKGDRVAGRNLVRLDAVRATIAPEYDPLWKSPLYLTADYQAELEKESPDPVLAGTYLGMVSAVPVTAGVVNEVNALLCVTVAPELVEQIAATAESQRQSLEK